MIKTFKLFPTIKLRDEMMRSDFERIGEMATIDFVRHIVWVANVEYEYVVTSRSVIERLRVIMSDKFLIYNFKKMGLGSINAINKRLDPKNIKIMS